MALNEKNAKVLKRLACSESPEIQALAERAEVVEFLASMEDGDLACVYSGRLRRYLECIAFGVKLSAPIARTAIRLPPADGWFEIKIIGSLGHWRWPPTDADRAWVQQRYGQTLEQLDPAIGMDMCEIADMLCNRPHQPIPYAEAERDAVAELRRRGV